MVRLSRRSCAALHQPVHNPSPKPTRGVRAEPLPGLSREQLCASSPAQLRARALRLLEMADEFPDDDMGEVLLKLAIELNARADALGRKQFQRPGTPTPGTALAGKGGLRLRR